MGDIGTRLTDKRMRALDKRIQSIYSQAYKEAIKKNEKWIEKLASLPEDTPKEKRIAFANEVERTSKMRDKIAADLANAGKTASQIIQGEMTNIYSLNYNYFSYEISKQAKLDLDFTVYDKNQITAIINSEIPPTSKIAYKKLGQNKQIVQRLGNEFAIATINGESQQQIIKRIRNVTGQSIKQARRVAQTERTRVQSQGRNMSISEANEMGVVTQKRWNARHINTRESHEDVDGEIRDYDEDFSNGLAYPGDPKGEASEVINCHCYESPYVKSTSPALKAHREKFKEKNFETYTRTL